MKATYLLPLLLFFSAPFLAQAKVGVGVSYPDVLISPPSDTLQVVRVYNTGDETILIDPVWNQTGGTLTAVSVTHNVTLTPGNSVPIFLKLKDSGSGNITGIVQIHPAPRNNTVSGGVGGTVTPSFDVKVYAKVLTKAEWNILHPPKVDDTTPIIDDQLVILIVGIAVVVAIAALLVLKHLKKKREEHDETPTCPPTSV
jgi:hypothetical protein